MRGCCPGVHAELVEDRSQIQDQPALDMPRAGRRGSRIGLRSGANMTTLARKKLGKYADVETLLIQHEFIGPLVVAIAASCVEKLRANCASWRARVVIRPHFLLGCAYSIWDLKHDDRAINLLDLNLTWARQPQDHPGTSTRSGRCCAPGYHASLTPHR